MRTFLPVIVAGALLSCLGPAMAQTEAQPIATSATAKPAIPFLDLPRFDKELAQALNAGQSEVGVSFYSKVTPNEVPVRLQKWLSAIEQSGGRLSAAIEALTSSVGWMGPGPQPEQDQNSILNQIMSGNYGSPVRVGPW